jgi:hypothetical protein
MTRAKQRNRAHFIQDRFGWLIGHASRDSRRGRRALVCSVALRSSRTAIFVKVKARNSGIQPN